MKHSSSPVVILGAARSGTKFLRGVLAAPEDFYATPFDSNHIWRIGNANAPDDHLAPNGIQDRTVRVIRGALWKLAAPRGAPKNSVLVEKTVSNTLRPDFVERVLPNARYILLIRDGRDVVESTYRMWNAPPDTGGLKRKLSSLPLRAFPYAAWYGVNMVAGKLRGRGVGVWGVRYRGIQNDLEQLSVPEVCAHQWRTCIEASLEFAARLDSSRVLQLRYEDIITDESALNSVAEFLDLTPEKHESMRRALSETLRTPGRSRWTDTFDAAAREKVLKVISPQQELLGYSAE